MHVRFCVAAPLAVIVLAGLSSSLLAAEPAGGAAPPPGAPQKPATSATATPSAAASASPSTAASAPPAPDEGPATKLTDAFRRYREARCQFALCWGDEKNDRTGKIDATKWGIEPLVELPVGKTFSLGGTTLGNWINSHDFSVSFAGGVRFWGWYDVVSIAVYFSQPINTGDHTIHVKGSAFDYPVSNVRRPGPGVALGLFGDTLWLGLDYQELLNGDSTGHVDGNYAPSTAVSRTWSITIGLATITSVRAGIATAVNKSSEEAQRSADEAKSNAAQAREAASAAHEAASAAREAASATATAQPAAPPAASTTAQPAASSAPAPTSSAAPKPAPK